MKFTTTLISIFVLVMVSGCVTTNQVHYELNQSVAVKQSTVESNPSISYSVSFSEKW